MSSKEEQLRELIRKCRKPNYPSEVYMDRFQIANAIEAALSQPEQTAAPLDRLVKEFRQLADAKEYEYETDPECHDDSFGMLRYCADVIEATLKGDTSPLGGEWIAKQAAALQAMRDAPATFVAKPAAPAEVTAEQQSVWVWEEYIDGRWYPYQNEYNCDSLNVHPSNKFVRQPEPHTPQYGKFRWAEYVRLAAAKGGKQP